jgi:hypothetical protein
MNLSFTANFGTLHVRKMLAMVAGWVVLALCLAGAPVHAKDGEMSKETKACLECHDKEGEGKSLANGEVLPLHIGSKAFVQSMHKDNDCEDCHSGIDVKTHGKKKADLPSRRAYALSMKDSCLDCHKKNVKSYNDSLHAALVKEGSKDAPLCTDCHNPHTVRSTKIVGPIAETPCAKCHEAIFKAYAKDVHGLERDAKGKAAPICSDCHKAHDVKAASMGEGVKDACLNCHKEAISQHKDWLPNTGRHFAAISCPVCHAPQAKRRVNLRLYDNLGQHQIAEKVGMPQFEKKAGAADARNQGLDERALWSLLKEFSQPGAQGAATVRGRLEVSSGVEAHQIHEKEKAISDCDVCHKAGAEAFQSVSLTIASADGRPIRHDVQKDVLTSLLATESIRGFYAIGSTRIKLLDVLLVLVVVGAMSVPLGHMALRRLFRSVRDQREAERLAASQATPVPTSVGEHKPDDHTAT